MVQFTDYQDHFKMCLVSPDSKRPFEDGWQNKPYDGPINGYNHGLLHEHSGTMAIDIDDLDKARELALERGINLDFYLMTGIQISSGVANHGKLIYKIPFPVESKKIAHERKDVINFRCTGNQDLLPPSIHPDTNKPYEWIGDFKEIPAMPKELFDWWISLIQSKPSVPSTPVDDPGANEIRKLLKFCDPDCSRMDWISIGFAVHDINPEYFTLWHEWSATATEQGKYISLEDCAGTWRSFKNRPNGITGKSLYFYAVKGGYGPSLEEALNIFKEMDNTDEEAYIFDDRYVPDLPLDVIPETLKEYAEEIAFKVGANPIVPVAAGLTAIATACNSESRLELQPGYKVPPLVWNIVIAPPAAKKSPASRPMFRPFKTFEQEDIPRYREECMRYEAMQACWAGAKKNYDDAAKSADWLAGGMDYTELPAVPDEPKPPVKKRFTMTDVTSQKVVDLIESRPEGLTLVLDEGKSWLHKISDPRSPEDRSFWTVSYEAESYTFDRVGRGSIYIENLSISAYVNVQPAVLSNNLKNLEEDGLFQRFTPFVVPVDKCSNISNELPDFMSKAGIWESLLRRIKAVDKTDYILSDNARQELRKFEIWVNDRQQDHALIGSPTGFQSALGKMLGLCGRYAFIFHMGIDPENRIIPVERVKDSVRFMKEYVYYTLRDVSLMSGQQPFDEWLFDWIITGEEEAFTVAAAKKSARRQLENLSTFEQQKRVEESLTFLAETGVIMQIERGSNRTDTFAVNPTLRERYDRRRKAVVKAKYRVKQDRIRKVNSSRGIKVEGNPVRGEHLLKEGD